MKTKQIIVLIFLCLSPTASQPTFWLTNHLFDSTEMNFSSFDIGGPEGSPTAIFSFNPTNDSISYAFSNDVTQNTWCDPVSLEIGNIEPGPFASINNKAPAVAVVLWG